MSLFRPAFIGGFRSGSTLLINLLGLHPKVAPWFETKELAEALRWLKVLENPELATTEGALIQPREPSRFDREAVAARMRWHIQRTFQQMQGLVPGGKEPYERYPFGGDYILYPIAEAEAALARWYASVTERPSKESVGRATGQLIETLGERQTILARKQCWINKTPELPRFGSELRFCLGACRIVLLIRNGWEVVRSAHALGWGSVAQLAWWWKGLIEQSRVAAKAGDYLAVRYEDLVRYPAQTLDRILEFLALPPLGYRLCEDYRRLGGKIEPPCESVQSMEDQAARAVFDQIAGDLMHELGYR